MEWIPDRVVDLIVVGNFLSFVLLMSMLQYQRAVDEDRRAARKRRIMRAWGETPRKSR